MQTPIYPHSPPTPPAHTRPTPRLSFGLLSTSTATGLAVSRLKDPRLTGLARCDAAMCATAGMGAPACSRAVCKCACTGTPTMAPTPNPPTMAPTTYCPYGGGDTLTTPTGSISITGAAVNQYANNVECNFVITTGETIFLSFSVSFALSFDKNVRSFVSLTSVSSSSAETCQPTASTCCQLRAHSEAPPARPGPTHPLPRQSVRSKQSAWPRLVGVQRNRRMSVAFDYGLVFAALHASHLLAALPLHPSTNPSPHKARKRPAAQLSHPCNAPRCPARERPRTRSAPRVPKAKLLRLG